MEIVGLIPTGAKRGPTKRGPIEFLSLLCNSYMRNKADRRVLEAPKGLGNRFGGFCLVVTTGTVGAVPVFLQADIVTALAVGG